MITLNGNKITPTIFPDKTSQVWRVFSKYPGLITSPNITITWEFENEAEIVHLAQLKHLINTHCPVTPVTLVMPYLPYARQDKAVKDGNTFALYSFSKLINSLEFDYVQVFDAHSQAYMSINNSANIEPVHEINKTLVTFEPDVIAYPDKGASDRYTFVTLLKHKRIVGHKVRDAITGNITEYSFSGDSVIGKRVLMIDDLCDGGATFVLFANRLYEEGASSVGLYVSHGIFSKGLEPLHNAGIRDIFVKGVRV